jgi:hypothetical protein
MHVQALGNLVKNRNNLVSYAIQMARRTHTKSKISTDTTAMHNPPQPHKNAQENGQSLNKSCTKKQRRTSELRELELDGDHSQWHAISDDRKKTSNGGGRRLNTTNASVRSSQAATSRTVKGSNLKM